MTHGMQLAADPATRLAALLAERTEANARFFDAEAERLARLCHLMAERFARGGRLVAFGRSPAARSDARHVAVEFVHPVIVGKRALPALGLAGEGGSLAIQVALLARPDDIAMAFGAGDADGEAAAAIAVARERGCLTIAFESVATHPAEWEFTPPTSRRRRGPGAGRDALPRPVGARPRVLRTPRTAQRTLGAALSRRRRLELPLSRSWTNARTSSSRWWRTSRRSVLAKAAEIGELRAQTLGDNAEVLATAAAALRLCFARGGKLLALGNGGSATDAMDAVADFRSAGRAAIDLTEDPAILTAIANDIGTDAIFSRQVIAYGAAGDALLALSTSGNSSNVIAALAEGRRRGLVTIAMVGYDGGRVAAESLADHVVVTRSEHIPRIQEAQASAYHALRALVR